MRLELFPLKSVGHFKFGNHIQCYTSLLKEFKCDDPDEFDYVHYEDPDESFFITVKDNRIDSIFCYKELWFRGVNLIGVSIEEFQKITESSFVGEIDELHVEDDSIPQLVYQFEELGLQVWERNKVIVTIVADPGR